MITIKEFYGDVKDIDESVLAVKSDCLWEKGSLLDIKNLVTPQLFHLHILVNLIGNWRYEGWWFIMCEMVQFVPYIASPLPKSFANPEMHTAGITNSAKKMSPGRSIKYSIMLKDP